jgi:glycogen debranching enzyme
VGTPCDPSDNNARDSADETPPTEKGSVQDVRKGGTASRIPVKKPVAATTTPIHNAPARSIKVTPLKSVRSLNALPAESSSSTAAAETASVDKPLQPQADEEQKSGQAITIKAAIPDHPRAVLKNRNQFMVMDESGFMPAGSPFGYGLYRDDTRYLSEWDLSLNGVSLTPLYESTGEGYAGHFEYANQAYAPNPTRKVPDQKVLVQRDIVISDHVYERVTIENYDVDAIDGELSIKYQADFADMFEVRGMPRHHRGALLVPKVADSKRQVTLGYKGLDDLVMKTQITFLRQQPTSIDGSEARFSFNLAPKSVYIFEVAIATNFNNEPQADPLIDETLSEQQKKFTYDRNKIIADNEFFNWRSQGTNISTDSDVFNRLLERGYRDLYILRQQTPKGDCLAAGIPWFTVAFGRDQDITGHETVAFMPNLAKNILEILASYQGTKYDDSTEESPGKIMHELRLGEMARCGEVPFRPFYGSVDSTPLWIILFGNYVDWTGDTDFLRKHWNDVLAALDCLDRDSSSGYLVYGSKPSIMANQGWKDSADSVMDSTGKIAPQPIALCEVQGYLYSAWRTAARLADELGEHGIALKLNGKADDLKKRFTNDFYVKSDRYIALALDGDKKPCEVASSNPGHLLATGILDQEINEQVVDKLVGQDLFCGWGIRTLASTEAAYNPISYHNGSVWPHDNAMAVEGMCKVGRSFDGVRVMGSLFDAAQGHLNLRLPELFCGFSKSFSKTPIWYPVSCEPQAWAAGSMFLMLTSSLGLTPDAVHHQLTIKKPYLPPFLSTIRITNIRVGSETATLYFARQLSKTTCTIDKKSDGLKVVIEN